MAQIIASTKEISNKRESLIVLSNSLKNKISLLETLDRHFKDAELT